MSLRFVSALSLSVLVACNAAREPVIQHDHDDEQDMQQMMPMEEVNPNLVPVPKEVQREGDPATGYSLLLNEGYVGCGVPYSAFARFPMTAAPELLLPGREGRNATLPYELTAFTTQSGVEVVSSNCLACHAAMLNGRVIVGLGETNKDFTQDGSRAAELAGNIINDPQERAEWRKWADRLSAAAPYVRESVVGTNPADSLALALFAHRDPQTLEWSNTPLMEPPPTTPLPVDVPPWWRMKKRNSMFYHSGGRGDHARIMMTASVLCVDSVAEADYFDSYFPHVRAYIASIDPPAYPEAIDQSLADQGRGVFEANCVRCHGTYGESASYPNLLVLLDEVGTDPAFATGYAEHTDRFRQWFADSFYGEISRLDPARGYIAPPLDGIWATAPFLHNGSVPSIEALLDSSKRPRYWTRTFNSNDYLPSEMSWRTTEVDHGQDSEPNAAMRVRIYDTTLLGHGNGGHTFGDALTADHRRALVEFLKTL